MNLFAVSLKRLLLASLTRSMVMASGVFFVAGALLCWIEAISEAPIAPPRVALVPRDQDLPRLEVAPALDEAGLEAAIALIYRRCERVSCQVHQVNVAGRESTVSRALGAVTISVSGVGPYVDIRRALAGVLMDDPALALNRLSISRRAGVPGSVEFSSEWTRYPR